MIYNYVKYIYSQFIRKDNNIYKIPGRNSYLVKNEILDNPKYKKCFLRRVVRESKDYVIYHTIIPEKTWKLDFKVGTTKDIEGYIRREEIATYMLCSFRYTITERSIRLDFLDSEEKENSLVNLIDLLRGRVIISKEDNKLIYNIDDFGIKLVEGTDRFMYYIKLDEDYNFRRLKNRIYEIITKKISQKEIDYSMEIFKCLENLFAFKIYSDIVKMESSIKYVLGE